MTKRQRHRKTKNISKHIKTSHKRSVIDRTTAYQKIPQQIKDINKTITNQAPKMEAQTISVDQLKKLLQGNQPQGQKRERIAKLSIDDNQYLERLLKKWGNDYLKMSKDVKLNKMQWTSNQIKKKHQAYLRINAL